MLRPRDHHLALAEITLRITTAGVGRVRHRLFICRAVNPPVNRCSSRYCDVAHGVFAGARRDCAGAHRQLEKVGDPEPH